MPITHVAHSTINQRARQQLRVLNRLGQILDAHRDEHDVLDRSSPSSEVLESSNVRCLRFPQALQVTRRDTAHCLYLIKWGVVISFVADLNVGFGPTF